MATIHDSPVAYAGGTFVGYTIIDPVTGAGAYKIGGGENGGILILVGLLAILTVFLMIPV